MPNIEFVCPNCSTESKIALMGETKNRRTFEKKCKKCKEIVELEVEDNDLINTNTKEKTKENTKNKVPTDYNLYNFQEKNEINGGKHFWVKTISFLILTASIMGLMTGISLYYAPDEFSDSDEIKIYIIVENKTNHIDSAGLLVDNENINQTYSGNGTYIINLKPGKLTVITGDTHIYKSHIEQVKENIARIPKPFSKMVVKEKKKSITDFTYDDFKLIDYKPDKNISAPMAV